MTGEVRGEAIELCMTLNEMLVHASTCTLGNTCKSLMCRQMKENLIHVQVCQVQAENGCPTCKHSRTLMILHAPTCRLEQCTVPSCREYKEDLLQEDQWEDIDDEDEDGDDDDEDEDDDDEYFLEDLSAWPLIAAAEAGDLSTVRSLLEQGADMNGITKFGCTAMWYAASKGHLAIVQLLRQNGADMEQSGFSNDSPPQCHFLQSSTPLVAASVYGHLEVVRYLLEKGVNSGSATKLGNTSLHFAVLCVVWRQQCYS